VLPILIAALLGEVQDDLFSARERERVARLELEAARSKEFYFVVDTAARSLSLKLSGVPLATYALESIDVGMPFLASGEPPALEELYHCVAPAREPVEIVPAPPPAPAAPASEPAKEEEPKAAVPRRVALTCEPALAVHLVSAGNLLGLRERLRLFGDRGNETRLRLVVAEADCERLFSSIPAKPLVLVSRVPRESTEEPTAEAR
jgi:hypothetical protein